jgi:hypothetical protein
VIPIRWRAEGPALDPYFGPDFFTASEGGGLPDPESEVRKDRHSECVAPSALMIVRPNFPRPYGRG